MQSKRDPDMLYSSLYSLSVRNLKQLLEKFNYTFLYVTFTNNFYFSEALHLKALVYFINITLASEDQASNDIFRSISSYREMHIFGAIFEGKHHDAAVEGKDDQRI